MSSRAVFAMEYLLWHMAQMVCSQWLVCTIVLVEEIIFSTGQAAVYVVSTLPGALGLVPLAAGFAN